MTAPVCDLPDCGDPAGWHPVVQVWEMKAAKTAENAKRMVFSMRICDHHKGTLTVDEVVTNADWLQINSGLMEAQRPALDPDGSELVWAPMTRCDHKGCMEVAVYQPVVHVWIAGVPKTEDVRLMTAVALSICPGHKETVQLEDVMSEDSWGEIQATLAASHGVAVDPETAELHWCPLGGDPEATVQ